MKKKFLRSKVSIVFATLSCIVMLRFMMEDTANIANATTSTDETISTSVEQGQPETKPFFDDDDEIKLDGITPEFPFENFS